jgi:hypothetical protein
MELFYNGLNRKMVKYKNSRDVLILEKHTAP